MAEIKLNGSEKKTLALAQMHQLGGEKRQNNNGVSRSSYISTTNALLVESNRNRITSIGTKATLPMI